MTIFSLHSEPVQDSWLDVYGHLNEAYYLVAFSNGAWPFQDHFGIGTEYFERTGCALYTLETHLRYVDEVRAPALLELRHMVLGSDEKRIHLACSMEVGGSERATAEFMMLHYDTRAGKPVPMPDPVQAALEAARIPALPPWSGQSVSLHRKKSQRAG